MENNLSAFMNEFDNFISKNSSKFNIDFNTYDYIFLVTGLELDDLNWEDSVLKDLSNGNL